MTITSRATLDDIKRAHPLEAMVRETVDLKSDGKRLVGCCPWHEDDSPSLVVDPDKDGGVWICHGCQAGGDVIEWYKLREKISFSFARDRLAALAGIDLNARRAVRKRVAAYDYTDEAGQVLFTIERWEPGKNGRSKDIVQRLPDGSYKKATTQVLYRLPEVLKAAAAGDFIFVVEGEKCAEALHAIGLCGTTHAGGSGAVKTWTKAFVQPLSRARVVLVPDNDKPGAQLMAAVARVLEGVAAEVRVLKLPVRSQGDDVVEWLEEGGTREQLLALAAASPAGGAEWEDKLRRTKSFEVKAGVDNAMLILEQHEAFRGAFYFDVRAYQPFCARRMPWDDASAKVPRQVTDDDVTFATRYMAEQADVNFAIETVGKALWAIAGKNQRDEVATYLRGLRWDKTERVDTWLSRYAGARDTIYTRAVARAWMISAVARALKPGCQVDHVLVLEGSQGLRKSTLLGNLAGGPDYFSDHMPDIAGKDASMMMGRIWIQELAELEAIGKKETPTVRAFLTRRNEVFRPPYGRGVVTVPRRIVFAATTNEHNYLKDPAGNRRYWPVACRACDADGIVEARDQLWAEAVELFQSGEPWWLTDPEVLALSKRQQSERESIDPWEELIEDFASPQPFVTTSECLKHLGVDVSKRTPNDEQRVGTILRRLGWSRTNARNGPENGHRTRKWMPPGSSEPSNEPPNEPLLSTSGSLVHRVHRDPSRAGARDRVDSSLTNDTTNGLPQEDEIQ